MSPADWAAKIQAALDSGAPPGEEDEHDMTPLAVLVDEGLASEDHAPGAMLLIKHGANPLTLDRALGKAFRDAAIGPDNGLALEMFKALIDLEQAGHPMHSEEGGNPLHVIAADAPEAFGIAIGGRAPASNAWHMEKDAAGRTPLHCMWGEDGLIRDYMGSGEDPHDIEGVDRIWEAVEDMVIHSGEAVLLARDSNKEMVANQILDCVEAGFSSDSALWPKIEALATREQLDQNTQNTRPRKNPGRL